MQFSVVTGYGSYRPGQRPDGLPSDKICQYKLVLLGKKLIPHDLLLLCYVIIDS